MSCPAMTIYNIYENDKLWNIENCNFFYKSPAKKYIYKKDPFHSFEVDSWLSQEERFDKLSEKFIEKIKFYSVSEVAIEDYSFGSKGKVFGIAENTGLLKHKLHKNNIKINLFAPSEIKKFSTGKGNSDKIIMNKFFEAESSYAKSIKSILCANVGDSPLADIVDSYFICKYLHKKVIDSL